MRKLKTVLKKSVPALRLASRALEKVKLVWPAVGCEILILALEVW